MIVVILGCIAFVAVGLWFIGAFGSDHPDDTGATVIGWFSIIVFGLFGLEAARRLTDRAPIMRVDDAGVWWKPVSTLVVPWAAITDFGIIEVHGQQMVGLGVERFDELGLGRMAALTAKANSATVGFPLCLNIAGTDRSFTELVEAVVNFHERASARR